MLCVISQGVLFAALYGEHRYSLLCVCLEKIEKQRRRLYIFRIFILRLGSATFNYYSEAN